MHKIENRYPEHLKNNFTLILLRMGHRLERNRLADAGDLESD
ncbi:hypothetical protein PM8797T_21118 [Gimesia maris DSM 8797]|nr:hypothetical protein PM8797T_21118 [Gimesia maris DSM 8797]